MHKMYRYIVICIVAVQILSLAPNTLLAGTFTQTSQADFIGGTLESAKI